MKKPDSTLYVLGIDLETTGLDVATCDVLEVGAVLWDCTHNKPVAILSELVITDRFIPDEIAKLTGLTDEDQNLVGRLASDVIQQLVRMNMPARAIVAHNGFAFDKPVLDRFMGPHALNTPWIDTMLDIDYPDDMGACLRLGHLAAEHGFLNPFAHRAVFDVLTMLKIFSQYDAVALVEKAYSPLVTIRAVVNYDDRIKAAQQHYRWDPYHRAWLKKVRECDLATAFKNADAGGFHAVLIK